MKERTQFNYAQRWQIEHSSHKRAAQKRNKGIVIVTMLSIVTLVILALPWAWQFMLKYRLDTIEKKIVYYQEVAVTLQEIDRLKSEIGGMNSFLDTVQKNSKKPREVLAKITQLLPAGASVTSFSLQADNSVQIGVVLPGPVDLARLWINFRDSGLFTDFDINAVSLTDEVQRLNLTLKLK